MTTGEISPNKKMTKDELLSYAHNVGVNLTMARRMRLPGVKDAILTKILLAETENVLLSIGSVMEKMIAMMELMRYNAFQTPSLQHAILQLTTSNRARTSKRFSWT